jgi:aryl-alcohol dehydrogenase-like predicted oxidoreductase
VAQARGLGVLAKRPLGNAAWRGPPAGDPAAAAYQQRHVELALQPTAGDWAADAVRFSAFAPGVSAVLIGTTSLEHLRSLVRAVERGPLPEATARTIRERFAACSGGRWPAMI